MFVKTAQLKAALTGIRIFKEDTTMVVKGEKTCLVLCSNHVRVELPWEGAIFPSQQIVVPKPATFKGAKTEITFDENVLSMGAFRYNENPAPLPLNAEILKPELLGFVDRILPAVNFVSLSISKDQTRPHLNQMFVDGKNLVTTDGHRLHMAKVRSSLVKSAQIDYLVVKSFLAMKKLYGNDDKILVSNDEIQVGENVWISVKEKFSNDHTFPPYDQVIPKSFEVEWRDKCEVFSPVVDQFVSNQFNGVTIAPTKDSLSFSQTVDEVAMVATVKPLKFELEKPFGINAQYLKDAFKVRPKKSLVLWQLSGPLDPIFITDTKGEFSAVVMPMRIK